jgi:hypothetical protein
MTRIIADISVSLDGFVTRPDPSPDNSLGTGGEALHTWAFSGEVGKPAFVVVTSSPPESVRTTNPDWTFVTAGLVDALTLHLAPIVLGARTPVFTGGAPRMLMQRSVTSTSTATHLTYDVSR